MDVGGSFVPIERYARQFGAQRRPGASAEVSEPLRAGGPRRTAVHRRVGLRRGAQAESKRDIANRIRCGAEDERACLCLFHSFWTEEFEAANQKEFAELIAKCDLVSDTVQVPSVLKASREVLIQEWLPGKKLTEEGAAKEQAQQVAPWKRL